VGNQLSDTVLCFENTNTFKLLAMRLITILILLVALNSNLCAQSKVYNVTEFGAIPNDNKDDWPAIQNCINMACKDKGESVVQIPAGVFNLQHRPLLIWGSNVKLRGDKMNNTIIVKKGSPGFTGDMIDILGLNKKYRYFFTYDSDKKNFKVAEEYKGETIASQNVEIANINFETNIEFSTEKSCLSNLLGITNSDNILISNCSFKNAPNCNIAIVNDAQVDKNGQIRVNNCNFSDAGFANLKVVSYNQGKFHGSNVIISNSRFSSDNFSYNRSAPCFKINGVPQNHIFYRVGADPEKMDIRISNCQFNNKGNIVLNNNVSNFSMDSSSMDGKIIDQISPKYKKHNNILLKRMKYAQ